MEMVGAPQVAPSVFMHRNGSGQFCPVPLIGRKRSLVHDHNQQDQLQVVRRDGGDAWNPKAWHWDSSRFVAKPLEPGLIHTAQTKDRDTTLPINSLAEEGTDTLRLRLGGAGSTTGKSGLAVEEPASSRPNKKLRSGSPSGSSYAICQVDNCKEDLSNSKDYHRRHKVCEVHSKSTKALVGKQMQRFCQQCSRFHPLSEFDEGKRSCRRRLAGHNWRRRKTQPDDAASQVLHPEYPGRLEQRICTCQSLPERNQRIQIVSAINSLPMQEEVAAKLPSSASLSKSSLEGAALYQSNLSVDAASESTVDLLAVLSATLSASTSDTFGLLSHISNRGSGCEKNSLTETDQDMCFNSFEQKILEFQPVRGERNSSSYQPPSDDSDCQVHASQPNLLLQLSNSSPEDDSPPKLASMRKYFSSDSSNPTDVRSALSSPPAMEKLFPLQTTSENAQAERLPLSGMTNANLESCKTGTNDSSTTLELFTVTKRGTTSKSVRTSAYQAGYTSSGSDCSPPSFSSDVQESTGRIIFKLFDKDPSHLPGTLCTQIYNWLSNRPSEMESYIRPGCIILSLYVSMLPAAWSQFEENLHQHVSTLIHGSDSDFWRSGRFLVHLGKHMASYKDGMIRVCKIRSTWCSPELLSVSPLAIVGGQDTSLKLRGRNLTNPGTRIHCTYMGDYTVKEVLGPNCEGTICEEITLSGFKAAPTVLGRCFIEVESGLKGNSFPVIIAGAKICQELSLLENEFSIGHNVISEDQVQNSGGCSTQEELLHFLNELGWLFQRKLSSELGGPDYKLERFQFLFTFSIERDYCSLVKTLLDILVKRHGGTDGLSRESLEALEKLHLLSRAVKRRCRNMVDLLIHYSVTCENGTRKKFIFSPNLGGAGGVTPLHLAASASGMYDIVDILTNDPQKIGVHCWRCLLDDSRQSPAAYALMRSNHSYNELVAKKLADIVNVQVSLPIRNEIEERGAVTEQNQRVTLQLNKGQRSCAICAATKYRRISSSRGLHHKYYSHSLLAIATICACVCLFYRGYPDIGSVSPFKWENLDFGTI